MKKLTVTILVLVLMLCCGAALADNIQVTDMDRGVLTANDTLKPGETTLGSGERYCVYVELYNALGYPVLLREGELVMVADDGTEWENDADSTIVTGNSLRWILVRDKEDWDSAKTYTFYYKGNALKSVTFDFGGKINPPDDVCTHCYGSGYCDNCGGLGDDLCSCLGGFCSSCTGMGYHVSFTSKGVKERTCSTCGGSGLHSRCHGTGFINCSYCHGTGICQWCKGR